jgi:NitT/TauT family transport system substrate-binding protein
MDMVRIIQRLHSPFYAPQFVAMHLGLLAEEGVQVAVHTASSGLELRHQLLSGAMDLGLSGPLWSLELAEEGGPERLVNVIEMNSRDGFFLVGHAAHPPFAWRDLVGRRLIRFAEVPTPWLCLQHVLRRVGVAIQTVQVRGDLDTAAAVAAFVRGEAEYLQQGQPVVETLVHTGQGVVVASQGEAVGRVPYSTYLTTPRFATQQAEVLYRFTQAVYRAQQWLAQQTAAEIATVIAPAFPGLSAALCTCMVARYQRQQTWARDPLIRPAPFDALQEIVREAGHITRRYRYREHVDPRFAQAAMASQGPGHEARDTALVRWSREGAAPEATGHT